MSDIEVIEKSQDMKVSMNNAGYLTLRKLFYVFFAVSVWANPSGKKTSMGSAVRMTTKSESFFFLQAHGPKKVPSAPTVQERCGGLRLGLFTTGTQDALFLATPGTWR